MNTNQRNSAIHANFVIVFKIIYLFLAFLALEKECFAIMKRVLVKFEKIEIAHFRASQQFTAIKNAW